MRIAIFQDTYHPACNGVVVSTDLFIRGLRQRGHEVMLVVPRYPGSDPPADEHTVLVDAIATDRIYPQSSLGKFWTADIGERLRAFKPDVVHSMSEFFVGHIMASWWAWKLRVPRVHTFHTQWTDYLEYLPLVPLFISRPVVSAVFRLAVWLWGDAVVVPTEKFAGVVRNRWGIRSRPVHVVPTGIDVSGFARADGAAFRARYGIGTHEKVVLYLGRLGYEKNVDVVIRAMSELRRRGEQNLRFVIAGGGPADYVAHARALAEKEGLTDILWTGFVRGQEWLNCYGAADLVLFASVTETQGLVVVESLAAGVPLVSVDIGGPGDLMAGEKGCLFARPDPADFADKAQRLLHDGELHARKRAEALALAREHSLDQRAAELEGVYASVLPRALPAASATERSVDKALPAPSSEP